MVSLIAFMLLIVPQSTDTSPPIVQPTVILRPAAEMPVLGVEPLHCRDVPRQVVFPTPTATNPIGSVVQGAATPDHGGSDQRVRMYHLLDRSIAGCPVPVIAREDLPDANRAIGRFVGGFVTTR